jgi:hypothetical protein
LASPSSERVSSVWTVALQNGVNAVSLVSLLDRLCA